MILHIPFVSMKEFKSKIKKALQSCGHFTACNAFIYPGFGESTFSMGAFLKIEDDKR